MITFSEVTKTYGSHKAVDNLNLTVFKGETCVLIGPSGCGKTTSLRMINRLVEPTSGRILIEGKETGVLSPERLRRQIGYVIQGVGLFDHLTVAQNIGIVPKLLGWDRDRIEKRVDELLSLVGLEPSKNRGKYPRQLSGGEQQRVGVARALAADPPVLLMDEPFGALDPITRERLQDELVEIQRVLKKTIVFVTHDMHEAIKLADRVAIMRGGKLIQYDTPQAILWRPADEFVRDFVGSDRVLKALGLIGVRHVMDTAPPVVQGELSNDALAAALRSTGSDVAFIVDQDGRPQAYVNAAPDRKGDDALAAQASTADASAVPKVQPWDGDTMGVPSTATVRDALSVMILNGLRDLAVVDDRGVVQGWVPRARLFALLEDVNAQRNAEESGEMAS